MKAGANENINIKLTRIDQNGTQAWHMEVVGQGKGGPGKYPPTKVAKDSSADFQFVITGPNTQGITFAKTNPISVSPDDGSGKSPSTVGLNTDQIINVSDGGKKILTFTDVNGDPPLNLTYQLNFKGAESLDPIIQNTGGGGNKNFSSSAALLVGLAVFAVLALIWLRARSRAKNDPS